MKPWYDAARIFEEYEHGMQYKASLGTRGLYEQNRVNERFMVGDQWHGARCGNDRPLVRHNVIKRIGDYKMAVVASHPITVNYSADGVPNTLELKQRVRRLRDSLSSTGRADALPGTAELIPADEEINLVMSALSDYFRVTAERVRLDELKEQALRNAYITGTGVLYTYWDDTVKTGLYADAAHRVPLRGDIACEVLDIENVYFGDPSCDEVQRQPYILLAQRRRLDEIRRLMKYYHRPQADIDALAADSNCQGQAGDYGLSEQQNTEYTWIITKLYKEHAADGSCRVKAVRVCRGVTVRPPWDTGLRLYPLAAFRWERRRNCAYGESEITYLIPNQIAINRMLTASVWAVMMMGMPIMVVNGDAVSQPITNEPGQIVKVYGGSADVQMSMRYLNPPNFSPNFDNNIASLINNTLTQSGANDSALGNVRPDNTSAIIAVREAATMPMQTVQNRFYAFLEEVARIWAEFWVCLYGDRHLKIEEGGGVWYLPFSAARYRDLLIAARVDVGASTLWSQSQSIRTLDNLFDRRVIDTVQYLRRLPRGTVPDVSGLIRELQKTNETVAATTTPLTPEQLLSGLDNETRTVYEALTPEQQAAMMKQAMEPWQGGETHATVQ